ncbi:MAG: hypothetical protein HC821_05275, partial [Lewinella sp.]|nr:hypothetical protein [Lewinella sp.]
MTVNLTANPVLNTPTTPLVICYNFAPPSGTSNFSTVLGEISGGQPVQFFLDPGRTLPIDPNSGAGQAQLASTLPSQIYAFRSVSGCASNQVVVPVQITSPPAAQMAPALEACVGPGGVGLFDLTSRNNAINGGSGAPVAYFLNANGTGAITPATAF